MLRSVVIPSSPPHPSPCQIFVIPSFWLPLSFFIPVPWMRQETQQQGLKVLARSVTLNSTNYSHYEVVPPPEPNGLDSNHTRRGM